MVSLFAWLQDVPGDAQEEEELEEGEVLVRHQLTGDPTPLSHLTGEATPLSHKGKFHSGMTLKKVNGLYVCRFCNKTFDRSFSVIRHERMHTGYKPCICRHCGRGFSEPRNLRQHMARYHNPLQQGNNFFSLPQAEMYWFRITNFGHIGEFSRLVDERVL